MCSRDNVPYTNTKAKWIRILVLLIDLILLIRPTIAIISVLLTLWTKSSLPDHNHILREFQIWSTLGGGIVIMLSFIWLLEARVMVEPASNEYEMTAR
ncbi:unnamed protein product [Rotaria sordida]|uniref:Uncharacterized protein n=2 Tax=Rotaria sordida TaxID=392033 RepID=A0A815ZNV8_9BILA|nr:unnamed protein product [Rotaria sordida]CAF1585248.1 unnamed protein product [Rotaria sordida]